MNSTIVGPMYSSILNGTGNIRFYVVNLTCFGHGFMIGVSPKLSLGQEKVQKLVFLIKSFAASNLTYCYMNEIESI